MPKDTRTVGHDYELLGDGFKTSKKETFQKEWIGKLWKSLAQDNADLKKIIRFIKPFYKFLEVKFTPAY